MVSIVSKNAGWITVNPQNPDRKHPLEKATLGDVTKTSVLTPAWMKLSYTEKNKYDPMKPACEKFGLRNESFRTFLFDKQ
jgi:hypothetical protein